MATGPESATLPDAGVAALVDARDWAATPLGPRESWSPSLAAAVKFILASGFPMAVRWGPQFVLIYNDGYRPILGEKHPAAMGRPFRDVWPEVQPQLGAMHEAMLAGTHGAIFREDLLLRIQRYGEIWEDARFTISYSPVPDETTPTGVGGVLITAVETTERVRMEKALRASEERFARIFQQSSVGVIECALDGRFLLANKRFAQIMGRGQDELRHLRMQDLLPEADLADHAARLKGVIEGGAAYTVERRFVRPDGGAVWVSNNVSCTTGADGKPLHIICVVQDVTERKLGELALAEREADLRLVLDSATDAVYCVDTEGTTTMCNAAFLRILGFASEADAIGRKLHGTIHHTHPDGSPYPKEECPIYNTARGGAPAHVDHEHFFRADGSTVPVEYWVNPVYRHGKLQGAVCTFIDITERKRALEQQSLLVGELNHRVKNLFMVASSMIALSARSATSVDELSRTLRGRMDALAAAHDLILPQGAMGQAGAGGPRTQLAALVHKILAPYGESGGPAPRIAAAGPALEIGNSAVECLALVLHELATNAAKYGALSVPEGSVAIAWRHKDEMLHFTWTERGGPAIAAPPSGGGFGTVLSNRSIQGQLGGTLTHAWSPAGLTVDISVPLQRLQG